LEKGIKGPQLVGNSFDVVQPVNTQQHLHKIIDKMKDFTTFLPAKFFVYSSIFANVSGWSSCNSNFSGSIPTGNMETGIVLKDF
jgi:hypothetical protein